MASYRESLGIISLRGARANIAPRVWKRAPAVTLTHGMTSVVVALRRVAGEYGCITRERVFFECPNCRSLAGSLAFPLAFQSAWEGQVPVVCGCRKCLKWRSREFRVAKKAPHVRPVAVDATDC